MKDLLLTARRGVAALLDVRVVTTLFLSGFVWTLLNKAFGWLLLGPALVVLFRICLKALRREEPSLRRDNLAVVEGLPVSLVAGILFALPFKLWDALDQLAVGVRAAQVVAEPGVPATATAALLIHFGFHVLLFAVLAERDCGVLEAAAAARTLADRPGRGGSRLLGLGRHLLFTSAVLLIVLGLSAWWWRIEASVLFTALIGPPAVMMLAAWYVHLTEGPQAAAPVAEDAEPEPSP